VLTHCRRGDEVILGDQCHTFIYEAGGISALGGVHPRTVVNQPDGTLKLEDIEKAIRPSDVHFPPTRLICLENTQNRCGGAVLTPDYMDKVAALARRRGLSIHLDGARLFNAAVALDVDAKELTRGVDSVSVCLSKGLAAPVGSVICSSKDFIAQARRVRKMLGGGMRQAGVLAAAGVVAFETMIERLGEDHDNAKRLAKGLAKLKGLRIDLERVPTNMVFFDVVAPGVTAETLLTQLTKQGVRMLCTGPGRIRAVTHYGITADDIDQTLKIIAEALKSA
jgi:threonine aldolase